MNDLISRQAVIDTLELDLENDYIDVTELLTFIKQLPSAEPEERTAKMENKWHWNCDPYDDSTSPTEAGYYRIIDEDGTEMTDYFFGEPRITGRGIGYWATCEKTILAWSRLEVTDERTTD